MVSVRLFDRPMACCEALSSLPDAACCEPAVGNPHALGAKPLTFPRQVGPSHNLIRPTAAPGGGPRGGLNGRARCRGHTPL